MESRHLIDQVEQYELEYEPPAIYLDDHIMDLQFSPAANVLAVGQITGHVRVYTYKEDSTTEQLTLNYHTESCR